MKACIVEFGPEDIISKLEWACGLKKEERKLFSDDGNHAVASPLTSFIMRAGLYTENGDRTPLLDKKDHKHVLNDLADSSTFLVELSRALMSSIEEPKMHEKSVQNWAAEYCSTLKYIALNAPVSENLMSLARLDRKQRGLVAKLDNSVNRTIYSANMLFSEKSQHRFDHDVKSLVKDVFLNTVHYDIQPVYDGVSPLETPTGYPIDVVTQLAGNSDDHAFNPKNDIHGRTLDEGFCKEIHISGQPQHEGAKSGYYVVRVEDNGFGMPQDTFEHLFERGYSTKTVSGTKNGIGVANAKKHIEINGGTISCKTELGEGSTWKFTIPYSLVQDGVHIQV